MGKVKSELSKLKDIGIEKIQKVTKLSDDNINIILNKKFDAANESRIKGTIYILERDMGVDLSEWMKEYEEYQNKQNDPQSSKQNILEGADKQELLESIGTEDNTKKISNILQYINNINANPSSKKRIFAIVCIVAIIVGYMVIDTGENNQENASKNISDNLELIEPNEENATEIYFNSTTQNEANITESSVEANEQKAESSQTESKIKSIQKPTITHTTEPKAESPLVKSPPESSPTITAPEVKTEQSSPKVDEAPAAQTNAKSSDLHIRANEYPLWIGELNLLSGAKDQQTINSSTTISLKPNTLLIFGHGDVNIEINGEKQSFNKQNPIKFHFTANKDLKYLTHTEYKKLGNGKEW